MRYKRYTRRSLKAEMNIVPYVDVMFVLLIIFMVTASVINLGVDVDLPQADVDSTRPSEPEMLILSIDGDGEYFLNMAQDPEAPQSAADVLATAAAVLARSPEIIVLVKADRNIAYARVVDGMVLLQRAGAERVGLSTRLPEG